VNRIAAGEVIQRPANAIKEMIENSIDAGATLVQVTVNSGGLKSIIIQDNGSGINKDDMTIVCERFTTSKLRSFEDLTSISTYGFRGEALASISHVAHVTITTRTANSKCAYKAHYSDGKLVPAKPGASADPRPCAGNQGTQILVEDLFYNILTRKRALKSSSEEFSKIADVIGRYAVHNAGVGFTLKKQGEGLTEIRTQASNSVKDNIGCVFGQPIARELLEVSAEDKKLGFKMNGYVSNANYSMKKLLIILFINHRLVESTALKKSMESLYAAYLPKNMHPFIYMSIEIVPCNVDVNVHPTKHEVHFLHEDLIISGIQKCVEARLLSCNESRTYYTQALLPHATEMSLDVVRPASSTASDTSKPTYAYHMVRTDSKEQKLDAFMTQRTPTLTPMSSSLVSSQDQMPSSSQDHDMETPLGDILPEFSSERNAGDVGEASGTRGVCTPEDSETAVGLLARKRKARKPIVLTSIQELLESVKAKQHRELTELFKDHKFVGCVDQTKILVQFLTKLFLIDVTKISQELFYQLCLQDFGNFGLFHLDPPAPIFELAMIALNCKESGWTENDGPKETLAEFVVDFLKSKADLIKEHFLFTITEEGEITSLPMLIPSLQPNMDRLPMLLLRLATDVNWNTEKSCFDGFAKEYSKFCAIRYDPFLVDSEEKKGQDGTEKDGEVQFYYTQ
jgi:DNA mismatch repair protein MLH1